MTHAERAAALESLAAALEAQAEALAEALVHDTEITIRSARDRDVRLAARLLRAYARSPERTDRRPLGKVAVFLPYNAVSLCGAMAIGGAFLAGNDCQVKLPARLATFEPLYAAMLEGRLPGLSVSNKPGHEFIWECFSDGALGALMCFGDNAWLNGYEALVRQSPVKVIFEGPGNSPFLVLEGANVAKAAAAAVTAGFANSGQSCAAPARFYVAQSLMAEFVERVLAQVARLKVGPPGEEATDIGPIGSEAVLERLAAQFDDARRKGARCLTGGTFTRLEGCRHQTCLPTVFTHCHQEMRVVKEEKFAPVMPVVAVSGEEEALALAEDSEYGLTATVYGGSERAAERLRRSHGNVFRDSCVTDPEHQEARMRWGGFRNSGWVWERVEGFFLRREGPRSLLEEFSSPA